MAAIIAPNSPLIPLICFMDLANFMFLSSHYGAHTKKKKVNLIPQHVFS